MANSVLVVEDHPIFRKGLCQLIETQTGFSVLGEAENKAQALELLARQPDLVLLDLTLGEENGLDIIKEMKAVQPDVAILVLSMHDERFYAERVLHAGARGYIMKQEASARVIEAIKTVLAGKIWLSSQVHDRLLEAMTEPSGRSSPDRFSTIHKLSDREFEIFSLIGKGWGTIEIAAKFNLSVKTVDTHKEHIKQKLHCTNSQDLRQFAIEWQSTQKN